MNIMIFLAMLATILFLSFSSINLREGHRWSNGAASFFLGFTVMAWIIVIAEFVM